MPRWRERRLQERPEQWKWVPELSAKTLRPVARTTLTLIQKSPSWVHRRVESLTFIDETVVRRHLSVDFTLPKQVPTPLWTSGGEPVYFVPLTFMYRHARRGPMHFDLRDEAGQSLPLLTSREQSRIMQAMLLQLAADTARTDDLPIETDDALAGALVELATRTYVDAIPIVRAVLNPQSEEWRQLPANRRVRHALRRDPAFADFLSLVAGHSVAIAPLVGPPGKRRVIKLTFEEPIAPDPSGALKFKQWIGNATGFRAQVIRLRAPLIGGAETHHYQVAIPRDVSITGAAVVAKSPRVVVADSVFDEPDHRPPNYDDGQSYDQQETGPLARADLRLERCLRPATGGLWVWLRADARGWLVGAIVASVFVAVALVTAVFMDDTLVNQAGPATSILLVVPGLTAVYMSRPGEHPLATRLLRFSRIVLALSGLCSFLAAAALLLLGPTPMEVGGREGLGRLLPGWLDGHGRELESPPELFWTLFGLAFVATVAALLLIAAYRWPRAERLR